MKNEKGYYFLKFGKLTDGDHHLFVVDKETKDVCFVLECIEDGEQYVLKERCPFCQKIHRHGAEIGFRIAHCGGGVRGYFAVLKKMGFQHIDVDCKTNYYIANREEYKECWRIARKGEHESYYSDENLL